MEIKVLGTGCASCKALYEFTTKAAEEMAIGAIVEKEEDLMQIMEYNVLSLPALVINGKVVSSGKKLSIPEVKTLIQQHS